MNTEGGSQLVREVVLCGRGRGQDGNQDWTSMAGIEFRLWYRRTWQHKAFMCLGTAAAPSSQQITSGWLYLAR